MTSGTVRNVSAPPQDLQLQNRTSVLIANGGLRFLFKTAAKPDKPEQLKSTRRKQRVGCVILDKLVQVVPIGLGDRSFPSAQHWLKVISTVLKSGLPPARNMDMLE